MVQLYKNNIQYLPVSENALIHDLDNARLKNNGPAYAGEKNFKKESKNI